MLFLPIFNKEKPLTKFFILFSQLLCVSDRFGRIAQSAKIKFIAPRNSHARAFLRFYTLVIRAALFSASWNRSSLKCDMQTHEFKLKLINEKRKISKTSPLLTCEWISLISIQRVLRGVTQLISMISMTSTFSRSQGSKPFRVDIRVGFPI